MKIEHVAFNVSDPVLIARWYVEHLGMKVRRRIVEPPYMHFLTDDSGTVRHAVHQLGALQPFYIAWPIVHIGRRHHLAALFHAGDQDRRQVGPRCVDRGCISGGS